MTIRLGILGIGSMGRHHVRNARATAGVDLVALASVGAGLPAEGEALVRGEHEALASASPVALAHAASSASLASADGCADPAV